MAREILSSLVGVKPLALTQVQTSSEIYTHRNITGAFKSFHLFVRKPAKPKKKWI
jgi:hypothetical protein